MTMVTVETLHTDDAVERGIREWHALKVVANEAEQRARAAEEEAARLKGQLAVLAEQKRIDGKENEELRADVVRLRAKLDEWRLYITSAGNTMAELIEKMDVGRFRPAGARNPLDRALARETEEAARFGARHGAHNRPGSWDREPRLAAPAGQ